MKFVFIILKKELLQSLRDRRTLITTIMVPAFLYPLMFLIITYFQNKTMDKAQHRPLKIAFVNLPALVAREFRDSAFSVTLQPLEQAKRLVEKDSLDAALFAQPLFEASVNQSGTGMVQVFYKSTNEFVLDRIQKTIAPLQQKLLTQRLSNLHLSAASITPMAVVPYDVATQKEQIGKVIGGIIPYFFIVFCFLGCMYPAIDLITGEKEKQTLETLLTAPISRFTLLFSKMIAISLLGLSSAIISLASMALTVRLIPDIPKELLVSIADIVNPRFISLVLLMLVPLGLFFAGLLSAVVVRAKSYKEAQSIATPIAFVVIIPASLAILPGATLNWQTVFIPIYNVALVSKSLATGHFDGLFYLLVECMMVALSILFVWLSFKQFSNEQLILE